VLVTRPQPDADATLAALAAQGCTAIATPVQRAVALPHPPLPPASALLLTSRNAVRAIAGMSQIRVLPTFCVGDSTAALARAAGFGDVASAAGDAAGLARLVAARCDPRDGPLLLPTARGAGQPLAAALRAAGFRVHRRSVYRMTRLSRLPEPAQDALMSGKVGWVLFHASGAAEAFVHMLRTAGLAESVRAVEAVAISAAAAKPLGTLPWRKTSWPAQPTEAAMLAMLPSRAMNQAPRAPRHQRQPLPLPQACPQAPRQPDPNRQAPTNPVVPAETPPQRRAGRVSPRSRP
jgi:uroporphyrinogen-III synthase